MVTLIFGCLAASGAGCAAGPAIGRGGPVYEVIVDSIDGRNTADRGPAGYPACTIQVGDQVRRAWLAASTKAKDEVASPVLLRADSAALKAGILVELDWRRAVIHHVRDSELAVGAAVVYIPAAPEPVVVELRFRPVTLGAAPRSRAAEAHADAR